MKKLLSLCAITLVIVGLVISSASSMSLSEENNTTLTLKPVDVGYTLTSVEKSSESYQFEPRPQRLDGTPLLPLEGDQYHPAFEKILNYEMLGFNSDDDGSVVWFYSQDDWASFDGGISVSGVLGDHPDVSYWRDTSYVGTFVCDYLDANGAAVYILVMNEPMDYNSWDIQSFDWSGQDYSNMLDISVKAFERPEAEHWWGCMGVTMSKVYEGVEYIDCPMLQFPDANDDGRGYIGFFFVNHSYHNDIDYDESTERIFSVFDAYNETSTSHDIFIRYDEAANLVDVGNYDPEAFMIESEVDMIKPSVAADEGRLLIAVESEGEILCLVGDETNLEQYSVATGTDPELRHLEGNRYVITYIDGTDIYKTVSENGGLSWDTPELIASDVIAEYGAISVAGDGSELAYQHAGSDVDIYRADVLHVPKPIITIGEITGGFGKVKATVSNIGDASAENVDWEITVEGGLVFGGNDQGSIPAIAINEEVTISSKFIIGFGAVDIGVHAGSDSETVSGNVILFFVNL